MIVDRRNLGFLLYDVLRLDDLLDRPRFAGCDRETIEAVFDVTQQIAENEFLPCAAAMDADEPRFIDGRAVVPDPAAKAIRACGEAGLFAAGFDREVGGMQLPATVTTLINGMLATANIGIANYQFLTIANAHMLAAFGDEALKQRFLPPMLEGRWLGTMCLSEPQAGSSLADIRTRADPIEGRLHRITGSKMWISGGDHELTENIVHMVLARRPDGPPGVKGISLFLVPKIRVRDDGTLDKHNNIALAGLNHKMGQRGTTNCLLNFGEDGDTLGYLIGEPHSGLACMFHMMNEARIIVGTNAAMIGLAGYLHSLDYARTRLQGRKPGNKDPLSPQLPIIEHADVRRMLLAQKAWVEGAIALSCFCTMLVDEQAVASRREDREAARLLLELLTPVVKSWPSEHCLEANKLAIQILGGYGYTRDYPVERFYRDNRLNHIHEGTFAIHGIDLLGRKVRMAEGRGLTLLLDRIDATLVTAARTELADEVHVLQRAVGALVAATDAVGRCQDVELSLANATLYLDAFGHVVIGWLWLEQALAAHRKIDSATGRDRSFYEGKLAAFRYFFRYDLPKVFTAFELVEALDDTCLAVTSETLVAA